MCKILQISVSENGSVALQRRQEDEGQIPFLGCNSFSMRHRENMPRIKCHSFTILHQHTEFQPIWRVN